MQGFPRATITHKLCVSLQAGGLPIGRTNGGAAYTHRFRAKRAWFDPAEARRVRRAQPKRTAHKGPR